jgi:hypothetical protein
MTGSPNPAVVRFLDPSAPVTTSSEPYTLVHRPAAGDRIGLLANGFPGSVTFLDHLAEALEEGWPGAPRVLRYAKGHMANSSVPLGMLDRDQLEGMSRECHVIVTAYGH